MDAMNILRRRRRRRSEKLQQLQIRRGAGVQSALATERANVVARAQCASAEATARGTNNRLWAALLLFFWREIFPPLRLALCVSCMCVLV